MKFCRICELSFDAKRSDQAYCSKRCRSLASNQVSNDRKKLKRQGGVKKPTHKTDICLACRTKFKAVWWSTRKFCSDRCRVGASRVRKKAKRSAVGNDARLCVECGKPIIVTGMCYDCASPGTRYIQPAKWLYERKRNPRFGSDGGAIASRIAA